MLPKASFGDPLGRALFVAAFAIGVYVLVRYWRLLVARPRTIRVALVVLRGTSLLLIALVLGNVQLKRNDVSGARVLLLRVPPSSSPSGVANQTNDSAIAAVVDSLRAKQISVLESPISDDDANRNQRLIAAVVATNGAMSAKAADSAIADANARVGGAPVFVMGDWPQDDRPRVALESVVVSDRAARGVPVVVRCFLHGHGMQGRESIVTVADDAQVRASTRAAWTTSDQRQSVTLQIVPKVAGWTDYNARIEAAGTEDPGTLMRAFALYAEERRTRVLFFEGEPTWEAKFIRRTLDESRLFDVDYFAQVSRASTTGVSEGRKDEAGPSQAVADQNPNGSKSDTATSPEARLRAILASVERLNSYHCVIVGATPSTMLSKSDVARLRGWIETRGGGLIVLGGNSFSGSIAAPNGGLYALLPTEIDGRGFASQSQAQPKAMPLETEKPRGLVRLTPTEVGAGAALRGYVDSAAAGGTPSQPLLTGQGLLLGRPRPGATIFAVNGAPGEQGTSETGSALIAATRFGAGRVLVFAPSDSWRMRTSASGEETEAGGQFGALWQGIALWSAANARPPAEVFLDDESPATGASVNAEVRTRDASFNALKIDKTTARLQRTDESNSSANAGGNTQAVPTTPGEVYFTPDESGASIWRASFIAPEPGKYVLTVDYEAGGKPGSSEKRLSIFPKEAFEEGFASDTLRRAARASGGELFAAGDARALVDRVGALPTGTAITQRLFEIRKWWPLALLIPLLLSCEWLLLKIRRQ